MARAELLEDLARIVDEWPGSGWSEGRLTEWADALEGFQVQDVSAAVTHVLRDPAPFDHGPRLAHLLEVVQGIAGLRDDEERRQARARGGEEPMIREVTGRRCSQPSCGNFDLQLLPDRTVWCRVCRSTQPVEEFKGKDGRMHTRVVLTVEEAAALTLVPAGRGVDWHGQAQARVSAEWLRRGGRDAGIHGTISEQLSEVARLMADGEVTAQAATDQAEAVARAVESIPDAGA